MTRMKNLAIMKARLAIIEMNVSVLDYTIVTTYKILYVVILVYFSRISRGGAFLHRPFPSAFCHPYFTGIVFKIWVNGFNSPFSIG